MNEPNNKATDEDIVDFYTSTKAIKNEKKLNKAPVVGMFKLGEVINNKIRYFGQEKKNKRGDRTAMVICPHCDSLWRVILHHVVSGSSKSCCWFRETI